jgi:PPIC-type PPIASE domain
MLGSAVQLPDLPILEEFCMRKSWLLCVLLGTLAWGQTQPGPTPMRPSTGQPSQAQGPDDDKAPETPAAEVPENAAVLTIDGVCPPAPKTAAASKTAATGKTAAPAKKPADCKTVITRKEFETIASALSPNVTPQLKRQLAQALPKFMAMSEAAKKKGLDKTPQFKQTLKIAEMQILTTQLQRSVQEEAEKVPPAEIEEYYKKNPEAYEQFSLDRLFIPRYKQAEEAKGNSKDNVKDEKLTEDQQKAKEEAAKAKQAQGEQEMNKLGDSLRGRAAAGEDFVTLQKEAFAAAGMKMDSPTVNLPTVRRTGLPPTHSSVFDLKVGEVSALISDNGGHYVYKVVSKEVLPLDKVTTEIHNTLKAQHLKDAMEKYQNSYHTETNEAYFGPPQPEGGRPGMPPHMPHPPMGRPSGQPQGQGGGVATPPQQTAPPAANAPAQPTAQPVPPSKPN